MTATERQNLRSVLATTAAISLLVSLARIWADPVVNQDATLYLQAAKFLQVGAWDSAAALYNWPFYSALIAGLASVTQLPVDWSANILSSVFIAITCVAFVLIVKELGGTHQRILWISALLILCFPSLNDDRVLIIRDHAYWTCLSFSTLFLFQLCKQASLGKTLLLILSVLLASLFRIEAALLLLALPAIIYISRSDRSLARAAGIGSALLAVFALIGFVGVYWLNENDIAGFSKATQITDIFARADRAFSDASGARSVFTKTEDYLVGLGPFSHYSQGYASGVLVITIFLILITEIIRTLTPLYFVAFLLFLYLQQKGREPSRILNRPWWMLVIFHVAVLGAFTASHFFLAGRYPMALAFLLMLPVPFLVDRLVEDYRARALSPTLKRVAQVGVVLFVIASLDGLISLGTSKVYLKQAGQWLAAHAHPTNDNVYFDNAQIKFYAGVEISGHQPSVTFERTLEKIANGKWTVINTLLST